MLTYTQLWNMLQAPVSYQNYTDAGEYEYLHMCICTYKLARSRRMPWLHVVTW